jgi:hypothetical protein
MQVRHGDNSSRNRPTRARNKLWAQDAMAEIEFLQVKLKVILARVAPTNFAATTERPATNRRSGRSLPYAAASRQWWRRTLRSRVHPREEGTEDALTAQQPTAQEVEAIRGAVERLLGNAIDATNGRCPKYRGILSWWSGNCIEAAFRNVHNAEAALSALYNGSELMAEIPEAARRARESLGVDDPMRDVAQRLLNARTAGGVVAPADLSKVIEAGHSAADRQRSRLRIFRNVLIIGTVITSLLLVALVLLSAWRPNLVPLCFVQDPAPTYPLPNVACPTKSLRELDLTNLQNAPSRLDFFVVATLGLMGGALSAALFIRDLYSNATPYNVSIPLAVLKLPAGALTGLVGIILLAGEFVPGFSAIDKPIQILAYALVFGFAQQLFTQVIDQRAQRLVNNVPTKARGAPASNTDRSVGSSETQPM